MNIFNQYRQQIPPASFARVVFAIAITVFVMVFEWADLKAGRDTKALENPDV